MTSQKERMVTCLVCESGVRTQMQTRKSMQGKIRYSIVLLFLDIALSIKEIGIGRVSHYGI
jgi:hypothetical protein